MKVGELSDAESEVQLLYFPDAEEGEVVMSGDKGPALIAIDVADELIVLLPVEEMEDLHTGIAAIGQRLKGTRLDQP